MKTLSFRELSVGRTRGKPLLELDSSRDGCRLGSGIHLIVAPNGYGKSTFLQTVAGVLPSLGGTVLADDRSFTPSADASYVSEYLTFPKFVYPGEWVDFAAGKSVDLANDRWVEAFGLKSKTGSYLGRMSQGERRKVTWIAAHYSQRPILLLDEPLDGLDLFAIQTAREMISEWKHEGRVVLIVAHQVGELLDLSTEVHLIGDRKLKPWSSTIDLPIAGISAPDFRSRVLEFYLRSPRP